MKRTGIVSALLLSGLGGLITLACPTQATTTALSISPTSGTATLRTEWVFTVTSPGP